MPSLVNSAGAAWGAAFDEFSESGWDKVVDLNLKSPFFLTQALHGALVAGAARGHCAKVINIASIDGVSVNPQETYSYGASKAGLIHLTRRMALRLAKDGIVVSAVVSGALMWKNGPPVQAPSWPDAGRCWVCDEFGSVRPLRVSR